MTRRRLGDLGCLAAELAFILLVVFVLVQSAIAAVPDVASASTIALHGSGVYRITGTNTINTITGVRDGDELFLVPGAAFGLGGGGNINALTATATVGRPIHMAVANGIVYEVGPSTGGGGGGGAPTTATYITQTPDATLSAEQALSALTTGLTIHTTATGVLSTYGGTTCTNQFPRSLDASGAATCATVSGTDFASQTAKFFFAAPNAANGTPTFRAMVASDVPTLNQNTTGTAAALTANPTDCAADRYATTIDASGNLTCAQVNLSAGVTGALPESSVTNLTTDLAAKANLAGGNTFTGNQVINPGSLAVTTTGTAFSVTRDTTATTVNSLLEVAILQGHLGTWAVGGAPTLDFRGDNSAGTLSFMGRFGARWTNVTAGSEATEAIITARVNSADTVASTAVAVFNPTTGPTFAAMPACNATTQKLLYSGGFTCGTDAGGSGAANYVEGEVDFGASGSDIATATFTVAWANTATAIICNANLFATADRADGEEDALIEHLMVTPYGKTVSGFSVKVNPQYGNAIGKFKIDCTGA